MLTAGAHSTDLISLKAVGQPKGINNQPELDVCPPQSSGCCTVIVIQWRYKLKQIKETS